MDFWTNEFHDHKHDKREAIILNESVCVWHVQKQNRIHNQSFLLVKAILGWHTHALKNLLASFG